MRWFVVVLALCAACSGHADDGAGPGATGGTAPAGGSDASLDGSGGRGGSGASTGSGGFAGIDASTGGGGNGGTIGVGGTTGSGGSGGAGSGGVGGTGGNGGFAGSIIVEDFWPPTDASCIRSCHTIGGQYCGRIDDQCRGFLDCPVTCDKPGFTCGGRGQPNVCGANPDSGLCTPTVCQEPAGSYCGKVGDGCGGTVDCGGCPPEQTCGGGGVVGLCAYPPDSGACSPLTCGGLRRFCGVIGDGCGRELDCGVCEGDSVCGPYQPNVCGTPCPLCNQIVTCDDGGRTTLRGTALTAAATGAHPLSRALVYIPNLAPGKTLPPLDIGRSCGGCPIPRQEAAVGATLTDVDGTFTLARVPVGNGIPLVVEMGKWRRLVTVDVKPCVDNVLPAGTVRLPRNRTEGDIPQTAVVTGDSDRLQCLLRKMGVDDTEFTNPTGNGRIHLYRANGSRIDANTPDVTELISSEGGTQLQRYSDVLFACKGAGVAGEPSSFSQLRQYVFNGGNVVGTHFASAWLSQGEPLSTIGPWTPTAPAPSSPLIGNVNTNAFPQGEDFARWLGLVGALSNPMPPQIAISAPAADLAALSPSSGARAWISSDQPATTQLLTFDTPIGPSTNGKCGRVLFSDFHVAATTTSNATFPAECDADMAMTPEEKALEFMLLGLGACPPASKGFPPDPPPPGRPRDPPPPPGPPTPLPPPLD